MRSHFSSDFFKSNRERLRQLFTGTAPIVITASGMLQRGGDSTYSFFQDANFWYLTGINDPDLILVMDKNQDYLVVPKRTPIMEYFDGALDLAALAQISGVEDIYEGEEGYKKLEGRIKKVKHAATLAALPPYEEHYRFYSNPARATLVNRLKVYNPDLELLDLSPHLSRLRMIKTAEEISAIQEAIDITTRAIKTAASPARLKKYDFEYQLEAELTKSIRRSGASGHSFDPIVAGGKRACIMHNVSNDGQLKPKDLVLIDTGAEVEHYAADLTRTFALSSPSKRQQTVFDAVLEVQEYAFSQLKPGTLMREYEHKIEVFMGEKLRSLGLIKTINSENVRKYFPSATSHFLGLNVHDVGDYSRPLDPGVVLTVEPGIYIPEEGIGIRIEDDVLITETGLKDLSKSLPKTLSLN